MKDKKHYVYFISDKRKRYVKIGVSNNPWWRIEDLQAGSPLELCLLLTLNFNDNRGAAIRYEDALHQHFAEHWRFKEWFDFAKPIKVFVQTWIEGGAVNPPEPPYPSTQHIGDFGCCLTKHEYLAFLKKERRA